MLGLIFALLVVPPPQDTTQARIDTSSAEIVLEILEDRQAGRAVDDESWSRLFESTPYQRLKKREASLDRAFEDLEFRKFVSSEDLLSQRGALSRTLAAWDDVDPKTATRQAIQYLPSTAKIEATIYPMIKPRANSFVFELTTDPAIFFYLDPTQTAASFQNTLTHELHHVGLASACKGLLPASVEEDRAATVRKWIGAFGEGLAMLAAAGGPDIHPHATSALEDRERWDRDLGMVDRDLKRVEQFFLDILDERLSEPAEQIAIARSFYGVQGPWYTVGWFMASSVEKSFGRERLISVVCDPVGLLKVYNEAAKESDPKWSASLLDRLEGGARKDFSLPG